MFKLGQNLLYKKCATDLKITRRFVGNFETNYHLFTKYFGLNQNRAKEFIERQKLSEKPTETIVKVVDFCEKLGFSKKEILKNPSILRAHPSTLDQYYNVMIEGGFKVITIKGLSKFRSLSQKDVRTLKMHGFIDHNTNVTKSFMAHLNPRAENLVINHDDSVELWCHVHLKVLSHYLKWRLQVTDEEILRFIKIHPQIKRKSLKYVCDNINQAEELGFPLAKILKYGYILHTHPKNFKEILEKFPVLAGVSTKKAVRMYPKLLTTTASSVQKIHDTLKKHNIRDEAIARRLNIFYLSPETVEFRLNELQRVADFKVLLYNPNILKLVVHHNRAKSRLTFLKELQLKCATVSVLGIDNIKFDDHIREGRDENSFTDTYSFLKGIFKKDIEDFEFTLKKHPYYLQVPLTAMEDTFHYLESEKFSNNSIFSVICILLYPKEKIKKSFKQIRQYELQTKKKLTQVNKLNLALYFIEKEHHFSGDGVWTKNEVVEESVHTS
ncbi:hypothetical protein Zmor_014254 [Zophobas morio]|uniref:Uncharacterized protein n=2 Tax=Zophobas morio TaxID=2755281 RepID=A0AA38IHF4_9CUCU|nr:hypothetical protein Zmor_014254 [Zophobas morio]